MDTNCQGQTLIYIIYSIIRVFFYHQLTNINDKSQISCEICDNVFASKQYLKSHIDNVHGGKSYDCNICSKHFLSKGSIKKHAMIVHRRNRCKNIRKQKKI